jgi:Zn-dependent protease with chaperone function
VPRQNFFENQARARRNTFVLVLYFIFAILGTVIALNYIFAIAYSLAAPSSFFPEVMSDQVLLHGHLIPKNLIYAVTTLTLVVILGSALVEIVRLSGGGDAVAKRLGGRQILPNTNDNRERRLYNIIEEMAIASGTRLPKVFVLDHEPGINAFAAGWAPEVAVIAVTRGALIHLSRDEMQGVIAHEFSHIFNGDMRINIRMVGILAGIEFIAILGRELIQLMGRGRSRSRKGDPGLAFFIVGVGLIIAGYVGLIWTRIIKSAVSRNREFLADASAVQYTRNPWGIGMALKKISAFEQGSRLETPSAEQFSHLFFGEGVRFSSLFATHPSLQDRLMAIDPQLIKAAVPAFLENEETSSAELQPPGTDSLQPLAAFSAQAVVGSAGHLTSQELTVAQNILRRLPRDLHQAVHTASGARAVVICLWLSDLENADALKMIDAAGSESQATLGRLFPLVAGLGREKRLLLLDLCLPSLREISFSERVELVDGITSMVHSSGQVDVFELALLAILRRELLRQRARPSGHRAIADLKDQLSLVFAAVCQAGQPDLTNAERVFIGVTSQLGLSTLQFKDPTLATGPLLVTALSSLAALSIRAKQKFLTACVSAIEFDGFVTHSELEHMRLVAATLNCPLPLLNGTLALREKP